MSDENVWVGQGPLGLVVFDRSIQLEDGSVLLYVVKEDHVRKFVAQELRQLLVKESSSECISEARRKYRNWKKFFSSRLKAAAQAEAFSFEKERQEEEELLATRRKEAEESHRKRLERFNIEYTGVRKISYERWREANCWNCAAPLDNAIDIECVSCGWILCRCGACGCGRSVDPSKG